MFCTVSSKGISGVLVRVRNGLVMLVRARPLMKQATLQALKKKKKKKAQADKPYSLSLSLSI